VNPHKLLPPPEAGAEAHVVPSEVSTLPEVPGATACTAEVPLPSSTLLAVSVVAPVPPLATARVALSPAAVPEVFWLPAALTPGKLMLADPSKLTPPIVRAVCRVVAVVALPDRAAVIVPAAKLPEASRATTLEAVFADVASTAQVVAAEPLKLEPVR
jgi:hypothetical protein